MKALMLRLFCAAAVACAISPAFAQTDTTKPATPPAPAQPKPEQPKTDPKAEAPKPAAEKVAWVEIKTSMGTIVVELDGEKAPISTTNFLTYVNEGFYDGTIFHRVIKNFMIQGGGFTDKSSTEVVEKKTTHPSIKNEWQNGLKNKRGTIAMARTGDPDSATSQFYINVVDNDRPPANLDAPRGAPGAQAAYAVFGKVISGMDVVDKIKEVATGYKSHMPDVPTATVTIEKARKLTDEEAKKVKRDEPGSTPAPAPAPAPAPKTTPAPPSPGATAPPKPKPAGG
jgi:cyclophilin family peptidyl-prolyl cis-trans isomerase